MQFKVQPGHAKKVKCGVLGAGWWASYAHLPALQLHEGAEVVALQKRDLSRARQMADDFGVPLAVTDPGELLQVSDLDAVIVSSTPNMHYEHAKAALEAGKHVLIEKPMTILAKQAEELVTLAEEGGLELVVSCPWHYTAHGKEARRRITSGQLGQIRLISVLMTNPISDLLQGINTTPTHGADYYVPPSPGSYSDPQVAGGGQIYCQVSHAAAYLTFLTDQNPTEVFARFAYDDCENDLHDIINVQMSGGALASIATTSMTPAADRRYEVRVYGTEGMLALELWRGQFEYVSMDGRTERLPDLLPAETYPEQAPAANLVDSILGRSTNTSPGHLGLVAMRVIEASCESVRTGANVVIARKSAIHEENIA